MRDQTLLDKLEFNKILNSIIRYCATETGKKITLELLPFRNSEQARHEGRLISEAKELIIAFAEPPLQSLADVEEDLRVSCIQNAVLAPAKILAVLNLAQCSRNMRQYLQQRESEAPNLFFYLHSLFVDKVFEHHITKVLDENGEVKDSASRELGIIRRDIKEKKFQLQKLISKLAKELSDQDLTQEDYLTLRDGRMVIPIRVEHKRHIRGFIHSESATGQTVYIEPEETLNLNNEIITLTFAEKREIERILRELTKYIGSASAPLLRSLEAIGFLDSIFARAQYSIEINGSYPTMDSRLPFLLLDARHPVLLGKIGRKMTVPLNLKLSDAKIIIVTGPNAGGKTVVVKTLGILTLMVFAGIHIPASPDSNFPPFENVYIDIGDQQSIEEDLSTFSSHLSNMKSILEKADEHSLVLLDELGTGTDPTAGAALGTAILMKLKDKGATVFCTTHHGSLKTLSQFFPGFENAAMEFDTEHLQPTYQFKQGLPGSSYAFEIAGRLGFNKDFISFAESFLDKNERQIEQSLILIEKREHELRSKSRHLETETARMQGVTAAYQNRINKLENEKREILRKAKEDANRFVAEANRNLEKLIKEIRESNAAQVPVKEARKVIASVRVGAEELIPKQDIPEPEQRQWQVGDWVMIKESQVRGTIEELYDATGKAKISANSVSLVVQLADIEPVEKQEQATYAARHTNWKNQIEYRLDIRGKRADETNLQVIKFLDEAYSSGLDRVEILHGKGTGALKKIVWDILKSHPGVKKHYYAPIEGGGEGITIIELKD